MPTYNIKITGRDGQRGVEQELVGKTANLADEAAAKAAADTYMRNFEGGKSHYTNVRCLISYLIEGPQRQWKPAWVRFTEEAWQTVRSIATNVQPTSPV